MTLLETKQKKKATKPDFKRTDAHKKLRLHSGWRKPKGLQNKMRLQFKGYRRIVKSGYQTPAQLKNKNSSGLEIVIVNNMAELEALDKKTQAALIGNLGRKKKEQMIKKAQDSGITLVNLSVKSYMEKTKTMLEDKSKKKEALLKKQKEKEEKEKKSKQKAEAEAAKAKAKTEEAEAKKSEQKAPEDKKEQEKKEQDKVLTSKKGY